MPSSALLRVYEEIERPLIPIIYKMQRAGVQVDRLRLQELGVEWGAEEEQLSAGLDFNPRSTKQLASRVYGSKLVPVLRRTDGGQPATDEETLEMVRPYAPPDIAAVLDIVLAIRGLRKARTTYVEPLLEYSAGDGRVHAKFWQVGTETGRMSSSAPNLQNIPFKGPMGSALRECFVAAPGCLLVVGDYSQIELRVLAAVSGEQMLIDAFARGEDVHLRVTQELGLLPDDLTGVPADVVAARRYEGKTLNFATVYGQGEVALARALRTTRERAKQLLQQYWRRLPDVRRWVEDTRRVVARTGYVETAFGRRRWIELPAEKWRREAALREAVNMPIQGTAADIVKMLMVAADRPDRGLLMQVHDELVYEVAEEVAEEWARKLNSLAAAVTDIGVPLVMEAHVGSNWKAAKEGV